MFKVLTGFQREWRLRAGNLISLWQKLEGWWEQSQCLHSFRPASLNGKPARHCFLCDKTDVLTPEEYFSAFGERGWKF